MAGPKLVAQIVKKIEIVQDHLRAAQDRWKKWADIHRKPLEFQVEDHIFLKVSPTHRVIRYEKRGKPSPQYIEPFDIIERVGERVGDLAYRLALPPTLEGIHNLFHVSQLRRYVGDESHVLDLTKVELEEDLSYKEKSVGILD